VQRFRYGRADEHDQIGQVTGLAWTEVGGELLRIESALVPGKGKFTYTGQLGDVMQESIQAAMTVVRSRAEALGIAPTSTNLRRPHPRARGRDPEGWAERRRGHVHRLVSALTKIPVAPAWP
jgi:ATP-dependent Lon protease